MCNRLAKDVSVKKLKEPASHFASSFLFFYLLNFCQIIWKLAERYFSVCFAVECMQLNCFIEFTFVQIAEHKPIYFCKCYIIRWQRSGDVFPNLKRRKRLEMLVSAHSRNLFPDLVHHHRASGPGDLHDSCQGCYRRLCGYSLLKKLDDSVSNRKWEPSQRCWRGSQAWGRGEDL